MADSLSSNRSASDDFGAACALLTGRLSGLLRPHMVSNAPALAAIVDQIPRFVTVDERAGELVVDRGALLAGTIEAGAAMALNFSAAKADPNSAEWLYSAMWPRGLPQFPQAKLTPALADRYTLVLSRTVQGKVIPNAATLALNTYRQKGITARHLVTSVLLSSRDIFPRFAESGVDYDAVVEGLIDAIIANRAPRESTTEWQRVRELKERYFDTPLAPAPTPPSARNRKRTVKEPVPTPPAPPPEPKAEALRTLTDRPASTDELNRKAFAGALAEHLRAARDVSDGCAFAIHLHGPWGSGKSTVLNFLKDDLTNPDPGKLATPWLVVEFNAWQHQRRRPPWWSLVQALYAHKPTRALDGSARRWWWMTWWRLRTQWAIIIAVVAALALVATILLNRQTSAIPAITATLTLIAALAAAQRWLVFGSANAAESYTQQTVDPHRRLVKLYGDYVGSLGKLKPPHFFARDPMPIAIFIDDLDRCDGTYVVELLEGIQTLMRDAPVAFVIAADRRWICTAFEQHYAAFSEPIGEPGRPLGYLFLDKLFQISAGLPALSTQQRARYWDHLLDSGAPAPVAATSEHVEKLAAATGLAAKQAVIESAPVEQQAALRAVAVEQSYAPEAQKQLEHRLRPFATLLEPNPRSMKRLVNAVAIARARCLLEGRAVALEPLARWTIIELRWPLVATWLADAPERIGQLGSAEARTTLAPPPAILSVLESPTFAASLGAMTAKDLQAIVD